MSFQRRRVRIFCEHRSHHKGVQCWRLTVIDRKSTGTMCRKHEGCWDGCK